MKKLFPAGCVYVSELPVKGRGVFAARSIRQGEIVEECPVCVVSAQEGRALDGAAPTFGQYQFSWNETNTAARFAMVFGFGALYNHSSKPNISLERDLESALLRIRALRDISHDEELTYDYDVPLWFTPA